METELWDEVKSITSGLQAKPTNLFDYAKFIEHIQFAEE